MENSSVTRLLSLNQFCGHFPAGEHFNLRFSDRLVLQLRNLAKLNPDVMAFQEVHDASVERKYRLFFDNYDFASSGHAASSLLKGTAKFLGICGTVLGPLIWLASWLFPVYGGVCTAMLCVALTVWLSFSALGQFILYGRPGLLLGWKRDKYRLVRYVFRHFQCQNMDYHNWFCKRGYQDIELAPLEPGHRKLHIVHTHLDAYGCGRLQQAQELPRPHSLSDPHSDSDFSKPASTSPIPMAILMGDLNAPPHTPEITYLHELGWIDHDPQPSVATWLNYGEFTHRLLYGPGVIGIRTDYILVHDSSVKAARIMATHKRVFDYSASDHLGILLEYKEGEAEPEVECEHKQDNQDK